MKSTTPGCPSALADALALRGDAVSKASERKQGQADRADVFCKGVYLAIRSSRSGYLLRAHHAVARIWGNCTYNEIVGALCV